MIAPKASPAIHSKQYLSPSELSFDAAMIAAERLIAGLIQLPETGAIFLPIWMNAAIKVNPES